jgi:hypothetical protein
MDINRPHTAVLNVQIEVYALDDLGQCSGQVLNNEKLAQVGLKPSILLRVDGIDAADCLEKLIKKLGVFNA